MTGSDETGDGSEESPFSTIQKCIYSSSDGDTILVAAGTYVENINYNGKNISVIGENRETTIIDGNQNGSVVTFESGEESTTLLMNFTVTNSGGFGESDWGGGVFVKGGSKPILTKTPPPQSLSPNPPLFVTVKFISKVVDSSPLSKVTTLPF
jgi:hypothetical protein